MIAELEEVAAGAITVELESKKIEDFDEYMFRYNFAVIHVPLKCRFSLWCLVCTRKSLNIKFLCFFVHEKGNLEIQYK